jgi:hypothetical protein
MAQQGSAAAGMVSEPGGAGERRCGARTSGHGELAQHPGFADVGGARHHDDASRRARVRCLSSTCNSDACPTKTASSLETIRASAGEPPPSANVARNVATVVSLDVVGPRRMRVKIPIRNGRMMSCGAGWSAVRGAIGSDWVVVCGTLPDALDSLPIAWHGRGQGFDSP